MRNISSKLLPIAALAVGCSSEPVTLPPKAPTPVITEAVAPEKPEEKIDALELDRQKYLAQMRAAIESIVLPEQGQHALNQALSGLPEIRDKLNRLVEKNKGRVMDTIGDLTAQTSSYDGARELMGSDKEIFRMKTELPKMISAICKMLLEQSPTVSEASPGDIDEDYPGYLAQMEADLKKWSDEVAENVLDLDLDEIQAHIDQYDPEENSMRSDMAIAYLPVTNAAEAFQGQFHRVLDLYLQLAHGNKAKVSFPATPERVRELFSDPAVKRLAIVGHGNWSHIGAGLCNRGFDLPPERFIASILLAYKKDPLAFERELRRNTAKTWRGYDTFGAMASILEDGLPKTEHMPKLPAPAEIGIDPNDPSTQKEIYRYTCGNNRYHVEWPDNPDAKLKQRLWRYSSDHPEEGDLTVDTTPFSNFISADRPGNAGKYEAELMHRLASGERELRIRELEKQMEEAKGDQDRQAEISARLDEVRAMPLKAFAPVITEGREYGAAYGKTHGYEGSAYFPDFFRDPLMENQGGAHLFKLEERN